MALFTELTVVRTPNGYRLFRRPIAALASLRGEETQGRTGCEIPLPVPSETVFALRSDRDLSVDVGDAGFTYTSESRRIRTTSGKIYTVCTPGDLEVCLVKDRRSVELYLSGEVAMSFFIKGDLPLKVVGNGDFSYKQYRLHSIWD